MEELDIGDYELLLMGSFISIAARGSGKKLDMDI